MSTKSSTKSTKIIKKEKEEKNNKRALILVIISGAIVIGLVIASIFYFSGKAKNKEPEKPIEVVEPKEPEKEEPKEEQQEKKEYIVKKVTKKKVKKEEPKVVKYTVNLMYSYLDGEVQFCSDTVEEGNTLAASVEKCEAKLNESYSISGICLEDTDECSEESTISKDYIVDSDVNAFFYLSYNFIPTIDLIDFTAKDDQEVEYTFEKEGIEATNEESEITVTGKIKAAPANGLRAWGFGAYTHILPLVLKMPEDADWSTVEFKFQEVDDFMEYVPEQVDLDNKGIVYLIGIMAKSKRSTIIVKWGTDYEPLTYNITLENLTLLGDGQNVPDSYGIEYRLDGGINDPTNPVNYTENEAINIENPTKDGYRFKEWHDEEDNLVNTFDTSLDGRPMVLVAVWEKLNKVVFDDGTDEPTTGTMENLEGLDEETTSLNENTYVRTGYNFVGWSTEPNGTKEYDDEGSYTFNETEVTTLYALWEVAEFTLTINYNGGIMGSNESENITVNYNESILLLLPTSGITKTDYETTWIYNTEADGNGDEVTEDTLMPADNLTIYLMWTPTEANASTSNLELPLDNVQDEEIVTQTEVVQLIQGELPTEIVE